MGPNVVLTSRVRSQSPRQPRPAAAAAAGQRRNQCLAAIAACTGLVSYAVLPSKRQASDEWELPTPAPTRSKLRGAVPWRQRRSGAAAPTPLPHQAATPLPAAPPDPDAPLPEGRPPPVPPQPAPTPAEAQQQGGSADWPPPVRAAADAPLPCAKRPPCPAPAGPVAIMHNGFVGVAVDTVAGSVVWLAGDWKGGGAWGRNLLDRPVLLETDAPGEAPGARCPSAGCTVWAEVDPDSGAGQLRVSGITDGLSNPVAEETWTLELRRGARALSFVAEGSTKRQAIARAVRRTFNFDTPSLYWEADDGRGQMMGCPGRYQREAVPGPRCYSQPAAQLRSLYTAGRGGCVQLRFPQGPRSDVVMVSSDGPVSSQPVPEHSLTAGVHFVAAGQFDPQPAPHNADKIWRGKPQGPNGPWTRGWAAVRAQTVPAGQKWRVSITISPNNADFPQDVLPAASPPPAAHLRLPPLDDPDLEALLVAIYATAAGVLATTHGAVLAGQTLPQVATSLFAGRADWRHVHVGVERGYAASFNFFDPDSFFTLACLGLAGEPALHAQVRAVLERSGSLMRPDGTLPHHLENCDPARCAATYGAVVPVYRALSGTPMPGPNIFWVLACLNHASHSGDIDWLRSYMPTLRRAVGYVQQLIDPKTGLVKAPGALFVDVLRREGFTSDTNAMAAGFFDRFAAAEQVIDEPEEAAKYRAIASRIRQSMHELLWAKSADHYVTSATVAPPEPKSWGSVIVISGGTPAPPPLRQGVARDFIDYDANLLAVAFGVPDLAHAHKILERIDSGRCAAAKGGGPQWISEREYLAQDTANGDVGDSRVAMGRIMWADALARRRVGDVRAFNSSLDRVRKDLLQATWLPERYRCDGKPETKRTEKYFEYPSVVAVLVREMRYGITLGLEGIVIAPFGPTSFSYELGQVSVQYDAPRRVLVRAPALAADSAVYVHGMQPREMYVASVHGNPRHCPILRITAASDKRGVVQVKAPVSTRCVLAVVLASEKDSGADELVRQL